MAIMQIVNLNPPRISADHSYAIVRLWSVVLFDVVIQPAVTQKSPVINNLTNKPTLSIALCLLLAYFSAKVFAHRVQVGCGLL